jgi:hypothetical protein
VVVALVGAGCGGGSGHHPAAAGSADNQEFVDQTAGFQLALPAGWQELNLDSPGVQASVSRVLAQDPQLAAAVGTSAADLQRAGVHLLALGPGRADANVVIRPDPPGGTAGVGGLLPALQPEMASAGGTILNHSIITVAGQPALHLTVSFTGGGQPYTSDQYYLVHAGQLIVLTVRAGPGVAGAIAVSLRLLG